MQVEVLTVVFLYDKRLLNDKNFRNTMSAESVHENR